MVQEHSSTMTDGVDWKAGAARACRCGPRPLDRSKFDPTGFASHEVLGIWERWLKKRRRDFPPRTFLAIAMYFQT